MSDSYERERQNNALLDSLSQKTSALKHITLDIYDNARAQETIDSSNEVFSNLSTSLRSSGSRLTRMARQGDKIAVLKLAGIISGVVIFLYFVLGWIF